MYPSTALPTRAAFAQLAYYDYMATAGAYSGENTFDNQGCDPPWAGNWGGPGGTLPMTCTSAGGCCDSHDACYAANNCTASSWGFNAAGWLLGGYAGNQAAGLFSNCARCNANVEGCMAGATVGSGPGQAACCNTSDPSSESGNTCGQGWGEAGADSGQCLCPPGSEQATPGACNSSECTGMDAGASDGGQSDEGTGNDGGNGDDGGGDGGGNGNDGSASNDGGSSDDGSSSDDGGGGGSDGGGGSEDMASEDSGGGSEDSGGGSGGGGSEDSGGASEDSGGATEDAAPSHGHGHVVPTWLLKFLR
jgi:hypothetical protein